MKRNNKNKSRQITVNNETYLWNVSGYNCDGDGGCRLTIWKNKKMIYDGLILTEIITPFVVKEQILKIEKQYGNNTIVHSEKM